MSEYFNFSSGPSYTGTGGNFDSEDPNSEKKLYLSKATDFLDKSKQYRILMVGNSHTYYNRLNAPDGILHEIFRDGGYDTIVDTSVQSGYSLNQHSDPSDPIGKTTLLKIRNGKYSFVILQESSNGYEKENASYNAFRKMVQETRNSGAIPIAYISHIPHRDDREAYTREFYRKSIMASNQCKALNVPVVYNSLALGELYNTKSIHGLQVYYKEHPDEWNIHQHVNGSYMVGLMLYTIVTGNSSSEVSYRPEGVSDFAAATVKAIADKYTSTNFIIPDNSIIAGKYHEHDKATMLKEKPASCTEYGQTIYRCSCGEEYSVKVLPNGHVLPPKHDMASHTAICMVCRQPFSAHPVTGSWRKDACGYQYHRMCSVKGCTSKDMVAKASIGDMGPSGGYIFYVATEEEKRENNWDWTYMEMAISPLTVIDGNAVVKAELTTGTGTLNMGTVSAETSTGIGKGKANTHSLCNVTSDPTNPAHLVSNLTVNGFSDWFIPSKDELCKAMEVECIYARYASKVLSSSSQAGDSEWWVFNKKVKNGTPIMQTLSGEPSETGRYIAVVRSF